MNKRYGTRSGSMLQQSFPFSTITGEFPRLDASNPGVPGSLAAIYERLYRKRAYSACRRLESIDHAIKDLRSELILSTVDVSRVVEEVEQKSRSGFWMRFLGALRNVFAILPLVLTWLALWQATTAYQFELGSTPAKSPHITTPFLELWQQGFDGHLQPSWLTFSTAAFLDFGILLAVLALTIGLQFFEGRALASAAMLGDELADALQSLAVAKKEYEAKVEGEDVKSFAGVIKQISRDTAEALKNAAETTKSIAEENRKNVEAARKALEDLIVGSKTFTGELNKQLTIALTSIKEQYEQFTEKQRTIIEGTLTSLYKSHTELVDVKMRPVVNEFGETAKQYREDARKLTEAATQLGAQAGVLGDSTKDMATSSEEIDKQLTVFNGKQDKLVADVHAAADNMQKAASHTTELAEKIDKVNAQLPSVASALENAATNAYNAGYWLDQMTRYVYGIVMAFRGTPSGGSGVGGGGGSGAGGGASGGTAGGGGVGGFFKNLFGR